jgi:hypothetical protein
MASYTAQILMGNGGGYDSEGIIPINTLFLSENSRPAWILEQKTRKITWIPTLNNMLEDGLLMLAIYALKDPEIVELSKEYFHNKDICRTELYDDITEDHLHALYLKSRSIEWNYKLIITVFDKSHIRSQISVLENYPMNLEVCAPIFSRKYSAWSKKINITGSIS